MYNKNPYILALLSVEGKFSCLKSAKNLNLVSHDYLTRSLTKAEFNPFTSPEKLPKNGDLIIDDSPLAKPFSSTLEGAGYVWCSTLSKCIYGYTFINIIWVKNGKSYLVNTIFYRKGGETKNELLRKELTRLKNLNKRPRYVLFDLWYAAKETLNLLNSWNWQYITISKSNRIFEGKKVRDHKFNGAKSKFGKFRGIDHKVQVVKHGKRHVMTNIRKPLNSRSGWKLYQLRWPIEVIFRDIKSFLHLEECSSRSLIAQINHTKACLQAYYILKEKFPDKSIESAQQEFLQEFHRRKFNNQDLLDLIA